MKGQRMSLRLSREAINEMFKARAAGQSFRAIGERFSCSDNFVSCVINRTTREEIEVPDDLVYAAQNVKRAPQKKVGQKRQKTPVRKVVKESSGRDKFDAHSNYLRLVEQAAEAKQECIDFGWSESLLELNADGLKDFD